MQNQNNNNQGFNPNNNFNNQQVTPEQIAYDIQNNKAMAIISYIGILSLIPFFAAKQSPFAQFHAKQGLTLFLLDVALGFIMVVLSIVLFFVSMLISPVFIFLNFIFALIGGCIGIANLVFIILGIVNASQGKFQKLPLIGNLAFKIFK